MAAQHGNVQKGAVRSITANSLLLSIIVKVTKFTNDFKKLEQIKIIPIVDHSYSFSFPWIFLSGRKCTGVITDKYLIILPFTNSFCYLWIVIFESLFLFTLMQGQNEKA